MQRTPRASWLALLLAAAAATSGCVDLPLVGNVGDRLKPLLPGFIRDRFFASDDKETDSGTAATPAEPAFRPQRRPHAFASPTVATGTTPIASQDPEALSNHYVTVNRQFDHLRTLGMEELYDGQTAAAIQSFQDALTLRPGDESVQNLIALARHPESSVDLSSGAGGLSSPGGLAAGSSPGGDIGSPVLPPPPAGNLFGGMSSPGGRAMSLPDPDPGAVNLPVNVRLHPILPTSTSPPPPPPVFRAPLP